MLQIKNALVHGEQMDLFIQDGIIQDMRPSCPKNEYSCKSDKNTATFSENSKNVLPSSSIDTVLELHGLKVYPGLIDIHSHGNSGHDTMDGDALSIMSSFELNHGITSWCPTTMTMPLDDLKMVCQADLSKVEGAKVLGFHLEGPYISSKYKGAQKEEYITNPDWKVFSTLPNVRLVTLAPELPGSLEFIRACKAIEHPPVVCLGHTNTDYDTALKAFHAGADCVTHMMNAMPSLHHRNPSLFGASVKSNAYIQVICDGVHIHPVVIDILYRIFGSKKMILISDSMEATGMPDGSYSLGGQSICVSKGQARMSDGTLAGSTTHLLDMVRHAIDFGIPEEEAFRMASGTPAELLGIQDTKGFIKTGAHADLIVVDDQLNLHYVILSGQIVRSYS